MPRNNAESIGLFISGAILGATVAFLYAPQSGARTRKSIKRQAHRRLEQLDELQDDFRGHVNDWVENVSDALEDGIERGRKITGVGRERVLGAFSEARDYIDQGKSRVERLMGS